jgi:hypothetical protein
MLLKKRGQSTEDRAREFEGALECSEGLNPADDGSVPSIDSGPMCRPAPEKRTKALAAKEARVTKEKPEQEVKIAKTKPKEDTRIVKKKSTKEKCENKKEEEQEKFENGKKKKKLDKLKQEAKKLKLKEEARIAKEKAVKDKSENKKQEEQEKFENGKKKKEKVAKDKCENKEEEQEKFENGKNKKLAKLKKAQAKKEKEVQDKFEKDIKKKKRQLDKLKNGVKTMEKELDETGQNQDSRISELDAEAEAAEKELQAVRDQIAAEEANIPATLLSDKDRKKLKDRSEIIAYLRKENKRLRSSTTHLRKDIEATQENNRRLLKAYTFAEASSEVLNGKYKINDSNNSQLMQSLDKYKKQNQELQGQMRMRQGFCDAEGKMRVAYQKAISVIVEMTQDQCDDADLTEDILVLGHTIAEEAKSELAAAKAAL